ncbi:MAG: type I-C CRISPR-associated protein Cas5 [Peptococcaceae bacterium]|nr:type I-C CRISPR-associated protein Cas5 [Peptococcaceae bacterium]
MNTIVVEVWGNLACFTRPETKVERFSYPVITPSAARGILDAIYAKPIEFSWRIKQIDVLNPISYIALRRNEVKDKISINAVYKAMNGGEPPLILCDTTRDMSGSDQVGRTQRQTMALKNVRYRIHAYISPRPGFEKRITALYEQAQRRIETGKCFYQPYLGCREFAAYFAPADMSTQPINITSDLGWMLYDTFNLDEVAIGEAKPFITLFNATMQNRVLNVPAWDSAEVRKPTETR